MRLFCWVLGLSLLANGALAADKVDPIAKARALYNERNFEAAVAAAEEAKKLVPARANSADLIAARAFLEHYRTSGQTDDLSSARQKLRMLTREKLDISEQTEWVVGLGELLYFEDSPGAAAEIFDSVLDKTYLEPDSRERVIEWWASALDREAQPRTEFEKQSIYQRVRERMRSELGLNPGSAAASYWLAAAARGQGDWRGAWVAVQAGWVRATLAPDRGVALRGDLERLMELAILPARARAQAQPPEVVRAEWEAFKARWNE